MLFLSVMLSNPFMKPISEIRLANLELLVAEAGTADALADRASVSPVYISQIRSRAIDVKTGKPRNLGSAASRKLERGMGKQEGWMDADHSSTSNNIAGWPFTRISLEDFEQLSPAQKEGIEDWLVTQVQAYLSSPALKSDGLGPKLPRHLKLVWTRG